MVRWLSSNNANVFNRRNDDLNSKKEPTLSSSPSSENEREPSRVEKWEKKLKSHNNFILNFIWIPKKYFILQPCRGFYALYGGETEHIKHIFRNTVQLYTSIYNIHSFLTTSIRGCDYLHAVCLAIGRKIFIFILKFQICSIISS